MVALDVVRASNNSLKKGPSGLVALFVGATSGIGEATMRAFYTQANDPKVYFVGRNQSAADKIISDLKAINPDGKIEFIKADVSLLKNVDQVTTEFKTKEDKFNLLFLSQGFLSMKGRDETSEGIDKKLSCNYYSRLRFVENLLPQLEAGSDSPGGSRVIAVLAAGRENVINEDDMALKTTFSLRNAEAHAVTFTSASFHYLQSLHPSVSFIHALPGAVPTGALTNSQFPVYVKVLSMVLWPIVKTFGTSLEETGQRHLYLATNEKFAKGVWMTNQPNEESSASKAAFAKGLCDTTIGERVWKHTREVFKEVTGTA